jgi:hypothetical protein
MLISYSPNCRACLRGGLVVFLSAVQILNAAPVELWVSGSGAVTNPAAVQGSRENPFPSIERARIEIDARGLNDNMTNDLIVNILPGEYLTLTGAIPGTPIAGNAPVRFRAADSGSNGHYVIYRAVEGPGSATVVGSLKITGWQHHSGSVWKINTGAIGAGVAGPINVIYENGKFAWPARKPNLEVKDRFPQFRGGYFHAEAGGSNAAPNYSDWIEYKAGEFSAADFSSPLPASAGVMWWKYGDEDFDNSVDRTHDWGMDGPARILSVTASQRLLRIFRVAGAKTEPGKDDRYFVQGMMPLLDSPGEFYHEASAGGGVLYYWPHAGGNPDSLDVRIPTTVRIFDVTGNDAGANAAHHLRFEGLRFAYTNMDLVRGAADGAISMKGTHHIEVKDCEIFCVGNNGVYMQDDNERNRVENCWIHDCGTGGIFVQNLLPRLTAPNRPSQHHTISNCRIHDVGAITVYATAAAGVGVFYANDVEVSHCDIFNSPRYATSLRGHWSTQFTGSTALHTSGALQVHDNGSYKARDNVFRHIRATDCITDSGDAGIVHAAHVNGTYPSGTADSGGTFNLNTWRQLTIAGGYADVSMKDEKPDGIFFDHPHSCLGQTLENIRVSFVDGDSYRGNVNPDSAQVLSNVSWNPGFDDTTIEWEKIGIRPEFPAAFDDRRVFVVDDHTSEYSETGAAWSTSGLGGLYKGDGRHRFGAVETYAQWRPVMPRKGGYEVSLWRVAASNNSPAAPIEVHHDGDIWSQNLDMQTAGPMEWVRLGEFPFAAGRPADSGFVRLRPGGNSGLGVRADALRFTLAYTGLGDETGWWRFDGDLIDASGYGNKGTLEGGAILEQAARGNSGALELNGTGAFVSIPDAPVLDIGQGSFAVSAWFFRIPGAESNLRILSKGAGDNSKKGYAIFASDSGVSAIIGDGVGRYDVFGPYSGVYRWHHVVLNINRAGKMALYIDGIKASGAGGERDMIPLAGKDFASEFALNIGRNVNWAQHWRGKVDDVRIFQRSLNDDEISALANPMWWKFDGSGMDVAGYGYQAWLKDGAGYVRHDGGRAGALGLDGRKTHAVVKHDSEMDIGSGNFALATWFYRLPHPGGNLRLLSKGAGTDAKSGYAIFGSNDKLRIALGNGQSRIISPEIPFAGPYSWNHLAVNFHRGGNMTVYLNGSEVSAVPISAFASNDIQNTDNLEVGRNGNSGSECWPGRVDELRLFKRTLSSAEVTRLASIAPDVAARTAPEVVSVVSRHDHAGRSEDLLVYDGAGTSNIEPRRTLSGGGHTLIVKFDQYVAGGQVQILGGSVVVDPVSASGKTVVVSLRNVTDVQKVTLRVHSVQGSYGNTMAPKDFSVRFLAGDASRDGRVDAADVQMHQDYRTVPARRNETGRVVLDTVADGTVDEADWVILSSNVGRSVAP